MDGVDPDTLLEWLQTGAGDERDLQLMALEQLCMLLLMSDNIDRCFESCPPRTFLPALCKIFLDETAPENCLEVTARAITYYLDVSNECTRRITQVEGAVKAICNRLAVAEMGDRTSKDLAEQCVKLLEHICQRETSAVYEAGGLQCVLHLIRQHGSIIHKDTMHSAMTVITRLCSKIEPTDTNLQQCSADLGALLCNDDPKVSECALRCFAALTDRFIRKSLDPVDLATPSNLVEHLLNSLLPTSTNIGENIEGEMSEPTGVTIPSNKPASFISIVLSLISNLCRGSAKVTDQLIRSPKFIPSLKSVLSSKDERCVVDSLRLSDLLIVLICEGRSALPKSASAFSGTETASSHGFDRAHRHLIDAIRQRDTDALIDAVENGTVDPNFTDDVGQTLLNWCSAFGTSDMVIYLCDKGADVNKGLRSSSLHYAACFGRSDIVKILLRYGANPDLRDEEGKTALDKARERNDEGHQQVVQILESPATYMTAPNTAITNQRNEPSSSSAFSIETIEESVIKNVLQQLIPVFCNIFQSSLVSGVRRSALGLIRKCISYISPSALRELLDEDLAKDNEEEKISTGEIIRTNFIENFMGVLVTVLEQEEEVDGVEQVLLIIKSLLIKNVDFWLEQLIRLGVFEKIEALAQKNDDISIERENDGDVCAHKQLAYSPSSFEAQSENIGTRSEAERSTTSTPSISLRSETDTTDTEGFILQNAEVVERARMLNIPVQMEEDFFDTSTPPPTVEIAGSESKSITPPLDSNLPSSELVDETNVVAQVLGVQIDDDPTTAGPSKRESNDDAWKISSGINYKWKDWRLIRSKDSLFLWCDAVAIEFSDGSNGWLRFLMDGRLSTMYSSGSPESGADNAETRAEFLNKLQKAKSSVPSGSQAKTIFSTPHPTKKIQSGNWLIGSDSSEQLIIANKEGNQQKLLIKEDLPGFIFESSKQNKHCFMAESTLGLDFVTGWAARGGGRRLQFRAEAQKQKVHDLAKDLWDNYLKQAKTKPRDALIELQNAAKFIQEVLQAQQKEIDQKENSSKLFETLEYVRDSITNERLLSIFEISVSQIVPALLGLLNEALKNTSGFVAGAFRRAFSETKDLNCLIRKMVLVLESAEKFPQFLYDAPGGSPFGLQLLNRRLRFRLEQADPDSPHQKQFINRTSRLMKSEPLTTVGHLKIFLLKMLVKRWFDHPRESFEFISQIKEAKKNNEKLNFEYESDFDTNGIIWWIGSNGKTTEWTNPASVGIVNAACSDGLKQPYGQPEDILSRDTNALNCHTIDSTDSNFTLDLGVLVYPTCYTLRHARGYGRSALRNWLFQGSKDNRVWDMIQCHSNDQSLNEPGSTATWPIVLENGQGPYRYFRVAQNGKNASGMTSYLSLSGFELYGTVVDVIEKPLPSLDAMSAPVSKEKNLLSSSLSAVKKTIKKNTTSVPKSSATVSSTSKSFPTSKAVPVPSLHHNRPPTAATVKAKKLQQKDTLTTLNPFGQNMTGTSPASAMAAEFDLYAQLPGGAENNKLAVGCSLRSLLSGMPATRSKALRYRRTNRLFGLNSTGSPSSVVEPASPLSTESTNFGMVNAPTVTNARIKIGNRVRQGVDWTWGSQGSNGFGTVSSGLDNGWVDVQWDDGTSNSYRFGFENKYDLDVKDDQSPTGKTSVQRLKNTNYPSTSSKAKKTLNDSNNFMSSKFANNPATVKVENKITVANLSTNTNTSMSQKSMSTTNLFDEKKPTTTSVASTNQAASAESLQHQTPSLENLLARSRVHDDRIPEVVGDDLSPISTPEPVDNKTKNSFDTPISVAASSIAGGSQPVLSFTSANSNDTSLEQLSFAETRSVTSSSGTIAERARDVVSSPREDLPSNAPSSEDITEHSARNLANLSVSAPNLAPLVKRQRWSAGSSSNDQEMLFAEVAEFDENLLRPIDEDSPMETSQPVTANVVQEIEVEVEEEPTPISHSTASSARNQPLSTLEPNIVDGISFADMVDVNYMNQIINSREFYGELVDVYSEMMRATEAGNSNANERSVLSNYVGSALLEELAMAENDVNEGTVQPPPALNQPDGIAQPSARTVSMNANTRRNLTNIGSNIRSRLGNYADVLRNMMQQVIESGGSLHGFDADDIDEEFFDEDMTDEGNEDDCDEFMNSSASNSNNTTVTTASVFQSQVETLATAAAALRRQFSNASSGSIGSGFVSSSSTIPNSGIPAGLQMHTNAPNDAKLNWRQIVMNEGGRLLEVRPDGSVGQSDRANTGGRNTKRPLRTWDDDFVLKRQFGALIPAFDPRPGRTNINQTQDIELPANDVEMAQPNDSVVSPSASKTSIGTLNHPSKIRLFLKGPNLSNVKDAVVELEDDEASIFAYVQKLMYMTEWGQKADKARRIWEPTYTIIYENPAKNSNVVQTTSSTLSHDDCFAPGTLVRQTMDMINTLKHFAIRCQWDINPEIFVSTKITQKLTQELSDPLVVSARALPSWCDLLVYSYSCLFTLETRNIYLKATAFGTSRAIVWLQNRRDQLFEQTRSVTGGAASSNLAGSRRDDHYPEFRIGRIKHERIKVNRNNVFQDANRVMKFHASRKSVLEIEYVGEEGTGLGPTLEFYALVAAEFQKKSLAMWLCDDGDEIQAKLEGIDMDLGEGRKPPGYYIRRSGGLFPAPLPPNSEECSKASELFRILGIFLAKVLQDGRIVDIPLSHAFLKLLVSPEISTDFEPKIDNILTISDLEQIQQVKGNFLGQLSNLVRRKRSIEFDPNLDLTAKRRRIEALRLEIGEHECTVEDLALTFVVNPSSSVFEFKEHELIPNGANVDVTIDNVELYVEKCLDFYLISGIKQQVAAFRHGFDYVFPLKSLNAFSPHEVQTLLSGDQRPEWTREDILKYTEPKLGYTRDSPGFLNFVEVLANMNTEERKAFLQFTTGCSSLPPGGLANLHPRLTIVRKVDSGDGSFPSVNTCVHYLKLPEYSSAEILRERLLAATNEKGFHLN